MECGYRCHNDCSEMVVQCRPRRFSPDSLSITDSEAESLSKFTTSPRASMDTPRLDDRQKRSEDINGARNGINDHAYHYKTKPNTPVKAYRKSLKQHVQNTILTTAPLVAAIEPTPTSTTTYTTSFDAILSPHTTAKAFSRLYPSTAVLIPPVLIVLLYFCAGTKEVPASQVLLPRYDEASLEYYANLERAQQTMLFLIRLYDNLVYHLQHVSLHSTAYRVLFFVSFLLSVVLYYAARWIILSVGLIILLNKTWVGSVIEAVAQFLLELVQTVTELIQRAGLRQSPSYSEKNAGVLSLLQKQRWWLLRSERSAWSNITGSEPLPSLDEMPAPPNYKWEDDHWHLDTTGPWMDDLLGIGWVYTDHQWQNPKSRSEGVNERSNGDAIRGALTRRRRWYRRAGPVTKAKEGLSTKNKIN
ncbi:hypothetical protein EC973_000538 [Apophysomyces ossiformis]|uniref:Uncharacterized protein n=1 Tax=Apophysomyces ossiformis TaxID=679940 RepID=A0A8H7BLH1_9FUNG|nr:hypothetical protein EC973_000538 [Apophysomyces ossiformis]